MAKHRRPSIRSGEESVLCSTALLRRGFTSSDFELKPELNSGDSAGTRIRPVD